MAPEFAAAIALLAALNAYALYLFLKSRAAYGKAAPQKARAGLHRPHAEAPGETPRPQAASRPLALREDLRAIEEELLSIRARLNNHEAAHLAAPEYASASGELAQLSAMLQDAKSENFSQLSQVAVELSEISARMQALEARLGIAPGIQNAGKSRAAVSEPIR